MTRLLAILQEHASGQRLKHLQDLAHRLDVPKPFVEALFTSAQRRGLIKPLSAARGKVTWAITPLGTRLLAHHGHETKESHPPVD